MTSNYFNKDYMNFFNGTTNVVDDPHHVKLWILGGMSCNNIHDTYSCWLSSTEYAHLGQGSYLGPDLPYKNYGHTTTALNSTTYIIIGGREGEEV